MSVIHVNKTTKEKISHCSWLNHFCNFKKKYIFNLDSEENAVFFFKYMWLLYTMCAGFFMCSTVVFFCPFACN